METTNVNKRMPSLGDSFEHGWNVMKKYFLILFLVVIVIGLIMSPTQLFRWHINPFHYHDWNFHLWDAINMAFGIFTVIFGLLALAYAILIIPVFKYGAKMMFIQAVRGERPDFNILVQGFSKNYLVIILANLLVAALVIIGTIALIVPGIIIGCRLSFVGYLVMDKKLDPIMAVEESWKKTRGHGWTIFFMSIVSFFIFIAGFCLLFVGIFPASIWVSSSFASLYEAVNLEMNPDTNI